MFEKNKKNRRLYKNIQLTIIIFLLETCLSLIIDTIYGRLAIQKDLRSPHPKEKKSLKMFPGDFISGRITSVTRSASAVFLLLFAISCTVAQTASPLTRTVRSNSCTIAHNCVNFCITASSKLKSDLQLSVFIVLYRNCKVFFNFLIVFLFFN